MDSIHGKQVPRAGFAYRFCHHIDEAQYEVSFFKKVAKKMRNVVQDVKEILNFPGIV